MNPTQGGNRMDELMALLDRLIALRGGGSPTGQYMPQMQTQQPQAVSIPPQVRNTGSVGGIPGLLQDYMGGYNYG